MPAQPPPSKPRKQSVHTMNATATQQKKTPIITIHISRNFDRRTPSLIAHHITSHHFAPPPKLFPFPRLIPSNFLTSASCTFLLPAHASRIFCMRSEAITANPTVRSEGFFSRMVASGVMPMSSRRRRSAALLLG